MIHGLSVGQQRVWYFVGCLVLCASHFFGADAFLVRSDSYYLKLAETVVSSPSSSRLFAASVKDGDAFEDSFLLQEFKTHQGELIDPYLVLKVPRHADRTDIKRSYRDLSRRYHPDMVRFRDILPGSCNNLDEVREHWERIQLAYNILSVPKVRARYDRHVALADPGAALQRAAVEMAWNGAVGVGKGIFNFSAFAVKQVVSGARKSSADAERSNDD